MNYSMMMTDLIKKQSIIRTVDVDKLKIPRTYLKRWTDRGELIKVARGIYISDWSQFDEFAIFQLQYPKVIYSFLSSLYLHGLTDIIPQGLEVTVPSGYNRHRFDSSIKVHYVKSNFIDLGKEEIETPFGNKVYCYDMERTICDLIVNRSKIDSEMFVTAIRSYIKSSKQDMRKLYQYASKMGITNKVHELMEVLYE